jgi:phosphatidylinositol glycan class A protein
MRLGPFAGPIYTVILIVDCLFFLFLEWWMPRVDIDYVKRHWNQDLFVKVCVQISELPYHEVTNFAITAR